MFSTDYAGKPYGIKVVADRVASEITSQDIDAVILPGGLPGADNLRADNTVNVFIDKAREEGKLICAICAAPRILGEKGFLIGKKATCYPGFEQYLKGAYVTDAGCVRDGNIVTAKGMGKSAEFALTIVEALSDSDTALKIKEAIFA